MNPIQIVETVITALQAGETEQASIFLSDNFTCTGFGGPIPRTLNKSAFLGLQGALYDAIPDMQYNLANLEPHGKNVQATIHLSGTQTRDLELPFPQLPPIQALQSTFDLPTETVTFTFQQNLISSMSIQHRPGGGLEGILQQLDGEILPTRGTDIDYHPTGDPD